MLLQGSQRRITPPPPYNNQPQPYSQNQSIPNSNVINSPALMHGNSGGGSSGGSSGGNNNHQSGPTTNLSNVSLLSNGVNGTSNGTTNGRATNHSSQRALANAAAAIKTVVVRYNRRNNPELEKRRIHHCDFLGEYTTNTSSTQIFSFLFSS